MKTIYLSHTELEQLSRFWELYVQRNGEAGGEQDPVLQERMDRVLSAVSAETRDAFLGALDRFELAGEEFQVRIAPDDAKLIRS